MLSTLLLFAAITSYSPNTPEIQAKTKYKLIHSRDGGLPLDSADKQPVIIGPTTEKIIFEHRKEFREAYEKVQITPEILKRWHAIETPCTIVVVFGSWCGDSHRWMMDLVKLSETPNPYITIHWVGTYRNKVTAKSDWPTGTIRQKVVKVPTFWLFTPAPNSKIRLVGSIVENPPIINQTMAEALIRLLESSI